MTATSVNGWPNCSSAHCSTSIAWSGRKWRVDWSAWSDGSRTMWITRPMGKPPYACRDVEVAIQTPGLRERLLELWTSPPLPTPMEDAVNCFLTVISPDVRGGRVLFDMMQKVEDYCVERDRRYYAWTASPKFRDWMNSGWHSTQFDQLEWNGVTMYGVVSRDLRRAPVPWLG